MKIYEYPTNDSLSGERVIALGFFDGVHIGHRRLLLRAVEISRSLGIPSAVFTFPSESALPKSGSARLYTTSDKIELISECGIDEMIIADFSKMKDIPAENFVKEILIDALGCRAAISGKDFKFGKMAKGDTALLEKIISEKNGIFIAEDDVTLLSKKVSTTEIKEYLAKGDIESANKMLFTPYFIKETVKHGRGVGHALGYPTVNTDIGGRVAFLRPGVYKTKVEIEGMTYPSLTNVGSCPTFGKFPTHAETFIMDFSGELYGRTLKISFLSYIREEQKFSSPDELIEQIKKDLLKASER